MGTDNAERDCRITLARESGRRSSVFVRTGSWTRFSRAAAGLLLALATASCAFGQEFCTAAGTCPVVSCANGGTTSISGTVYAPNGVDPLPNILVYVPSTYYSGSIPANSASLSNGLSPLVDGVVGVTNDSAATLVTNSPLVQTTTAINGTFTLTNAPVGSQVPVVIQAGRWRRLFFIGTARCAATTGQSLSFPSTQLQGDIPKIALVTGKSDALECTLRKMGIADSEFTDSGTIVSGGTYGRVNLYTGYKGPGAKVDSSTPAEATLMGASTSPYGASVPLSGYNVLMLPCQGNNTNYQNTNNDGPNFLAFVNNGGRAFATHYSGDYLADEYPSSAGWDVGGLGSLPSDPDTATINTSFSGGATIASWLQGIFPASTLGSVSVSTLRLDQWGVNSPAQEWLNYSGSSLTIGGHTVTNPALQFSFYAPWGAAASSQYGRVMFNDYHVDNASVSSGTTFPNECVNDSSSSRALATGSAATSPATNMSPQEHMLEYSLFDLMNFAVPVTDVSTIVGISIAPSPMTVTGGDAADPIEIQLDNNGTTSSQDIGSNPQVVLSVSLPSGLTATSMTDPTGTWSCTTSTLSCVLTHTWTHGISYTIDMTVSVAANVAASNSSSIAATASSTGFTASISSPLTITVVAAPPNTISGPESSSLSATSIGSSTTGTVTFALSNPTTITSIVVVTQGSTGLDFTNNGTGSCTATTYSTTGATCTVAVKFTPLAPGLRTGAVEIFNGSTLLATTYISAVGIGPLATVAPGATTTVSAGTLGQPAGVAADAAGNLYIADAANNVVIKVAPGGTYATYAGGGSSGMGDGGPATAATLSAPQDVAIDGAGNLYIADSGNNRVRVVSALTGLISTVAGGATPASGVGDGGPATSAELAAPSSVAIDGSGNLFIADQGNHRVREVAAGSGTISTVAGNGSAGSSGDGGPATSATLSSPSGIALDAAGDLYIADSVNCTVRMVSASSGAIQAVAGNGSCGDAGDGGAATSAELNQPNAVRLDAAGNLYVSDTANGRVRLVVGTSMITTIAGGGSQTTATGAISATSAALIPYGLTLDAAGNLYVASGGGAPSVDKVSSGSASIAFPTATAVGSSDTTDGIGTAMLLNTGNTTLSAVAPGLAPVADFAQQTGNGDDCTASFSLGSGNTCALRFTFAPTASGALSENFVIQDNSFQATLASQPSTTQTVALLGSGGTTSAATTVTASAATATYSGSNQPVTLAASVTSTSTVNAGTVTFTLMSGSAVIGAATTSGTVTNGAASVSYLLPGGTPAGSYTIDAVYNAAGGFATSSDTSHSLTINQAALEFDPAALNFSGQLVGSNSSPQTLTLTNPNSFALTITGIQASGDFAVSDACPTIAAGSNCTVSVTFTPSASGSRTGVLAVSNAQSSLAQTVALSGTGIAPSIVVSPSTLSFGSQVISTTSTGQTLTVANTGTAPLVISSVTTTGDFATSGNCGNVPAGSNCSLTVTFTPTAIGSRTGTVALTNSTGGQSQVVRLSGMGTQAGAVLTPGAQAFPATLVGSASQPLTATLTNAGGAALSGIAIAITGDFTQTNNCPASLASGSTCRLNIVYAPTAAGAESGTLTVTDNLGSQTISLAGTGLTPGASLDNAQLLFGSQLLNTSSLGQTVTFTNTGTAPVIINSVTPTANFTDTTNCAGVVAPGASCSVNVAFAPTATGLLAGTVTIDSSVGSQVVTLQGQGVSPGATITPSFLLFGSQVVNTASLAQTLTVRNTGTTPLTLNPITVSSNFVESDQCPAVLPAGSSCLISVSFAPTATGTLYGSLQFSDTGGQVATVVALSGQGTLPGIATTPSTLFFGSLPLGTASQAQTVTVWNSGAVPLQIASVKATGDFAETDTCTANAVPAGSYCVVNVTMTPTTLGTRTGTIQITDSADGLHLISLSGVGQQAGVNVFPTSLAFGSLPVGTSQTTGTALGVALTNTGSVPLQLSGISTQGDFTETDTCGSSVAVGSTCTLTVNFAPTALGHRTGMLTINDNAGGGAQQVALAGDGSPSGLILTPPVINFGVQTIGQQSTSQPATLTNNTGQTLSDLVITPSGEYSETDTCGAALANGASCTINITVTPTNTGAITGTVTLSSGTASTLSGQSAQLRSAAKLAKALASSSSSSTVGVVALSASAIPAGIDLSLPQLSFSVASVGTPSTGQTITLRNTGSSVSLTHLSISETNAAEFPFTTTCPATLAAQAVCTITVNFLATGYGLRIGVMNITADNGIAAVLPESGSASQATPTVTLAGNQAVTMLLSPVTFTSTVSSQGTTPTGTVMFMDGTTVLGTSALSGGTASLTTSALAAGMHSIVAIYGGDTNYGTATSSPLAETVLDFSLKPTGSAGASQTVIPGNSVTYQVAITPTSGTSFPVAAILTVSGLPQGATATLNTTQWTQLTATSWQVPATTTLSNVSLTFHLPEQTIASQTANSTGNGLPPLLWGVLLLPFACRLRRAGKTLARHLLILLVAVASLAAVTGLSGCGTRNGFFGQTPQTYTVTVTVTAGSVSHSTDLTLNVQ